MSKLKTTLGAAFVAMFASQALAQDCVWRIEDFDRLLDLAAEEAISESTGGYAVAGSREAQAVQDTGAAADEGPEEPVIPVQDEQKEAAAVEEADEAGDAGENVIDARTALQEARELAESGNEDACARALDEVIVKLIAD